MTLSPLGPELGKIRNVDYFHIFVPPLTLAKTVPKSYLTGLANMGGDGGGPPHIEG